MKISFQNVNERVCEKSEGSALFGKRIQVRRPAAS